MAAAYERGDCLCGGIFGTGTNGAYVEDIDRLTKMGFQAAELEENKRHGLDNMVVNTEWGAFDNEVRQALSLTPLRTGCRRAAC